MTFPTPYSQRAQPHCNIRLGRSRYAVGDSGCVGCDVLFNINRHLGRNITPSSFFNDMNRRGAFDDRGSFRWSKVAEYTGGKLRYLGNNLWAKLRKKYTLQQVDFGPAGHYVALMPGNQAYDSHHGRITKIVNGAIEIEGRMRRFLPNVRYLG